MKEYRIQLFTQCGKKWINLSDFVKTPLKTETQAKQELADRQKDHPHNVYRIISRDVTEWEIMDIKEVQQ